jgi:hypothetical protein
MTNPSKDEAGGALFGRFNPLPEATDQCPSIPDLASNAKGKEQKWTLHISSCDHCSQLTKLLSGIDPTRSLQDFLWMTREQALKGAPDRPASVFSFIRAFFANQPRWVYAAVAIVVITVASWGLWNDKLVSRQEYAQDTSVSFPEDTYQKTVLALTEDLQKSEIPGDRKELQPRVDEINTNLTKLQGRLDRTQRAELAQLVNQYNVAIAVRIKPTQMAAPASRPEVGIAGNKDSEIVGDLYRAIDEAAANQTASGSNSGASSKSVEANVPASYQLEIVAMDDKQIDLQDRSANRPVQQQEAIRLGIKSFESRSNMKVAFGNSFAKRP